MGLIRIEQRGNGSQMLARLIQSIRKVQAMTPRVVLTKMVGDVLVDKARDCFQTGTDPFGMRWARPEHALHHPLLFKTGRLYNSIRNESVDGAVVLTASAPYASFHNDGTRTLPQRKFLPKRVMPLSWANEATRIVERAVAEVLK